VKEDEETITNKTGTHWFWKMKKENLNMTDSCLFVKTPKTISLRYFAGGGGGGVRVLGRKISGGTIFTT